MPSIKEKSKLTSGRDAGFCITEKQRIASRFLKAQAGLENNIFSFRAPENLFYFLQRLADVEQRTNFILEALNFYLYFKRDPKNFLESLYFRNPRLWKKINRNMRGRDKRIRMRFALEKSARQDSGF